MSIRGLFVGRVSAFALLGTILGMLLAPITASFGEDAIAYCGGFGGKVFGFEIVGDRAYVVEGGALAIYDLSNPSSFLLLGRVLLPEANLTHSAFARIKISGDRVYAGFINSEYLSSKANSFSIHAIDISTPATPVWLGSYKPEHAIGDFAVSGNYVFFEDKADSWTEYRLVSLDMTQPATPAIAGTLPVAPLFTVFWIEGATLNAIAGFSYLASFDITTPTAPTLITQNQISPTTELFPNNAVKESTTLYVASSNFLDGENYFCIYDISVPSSPVVLSETLLPNSHGISDVAVAGQVAYVLSKEVYVSPEDTYKLFMYNISDPAAPASLGNFALGKGNANRIARVGSSLYVSYSEDGIARIDITQPESPVNAGTVLPGNAFALALSKDYVYATFADGLRVFSRETVGMTHQENFVPCATIPTALALRGEQIYMASGTEGLRIFDTEASGALSEHPAQHPLDTVSGLLLYNDRLLLAGMDTLSGMNRFAVCDLSNPYSPVVLGACDTNASAYKMYAMRGTCYIYWPYIGCSVNFRNETAPSANQDIFMDVTAMYGANALEMGITIGILFLGPTTYITGLSHFNTLALRDDEAFFGCDGAMGWTGGVNYSVPYEPPVLKSKVVSAVTLIPTGSAVRGNYVYLIGDQGLSVYRAPVGSVPDRTARFQDQGEALAAKAVTLGIDGNGDGVVNEEDTDFNAWDTNNDTIPDAWQLALLADCINDGIPPYDVNAARAYLTNWSAVADAPSDACRTYTTVIAGLLTLSEASRQVLEEAQTLGVGADAYDSWKIAGGEPLGGDYDFDGDGATNLEEMTNCLGFSGGEREYLRAVTHAEITGAAFPVAGTFGMAGLIVALAVLGVGLQWMPRRRRMGRESVPD